MIDRRKFIKGASASGVAALALRNASGPVEARELGPSIVPTGGRTISLDLVAAERQSALPAFGGRTMPIWTFADGAWPLIVRMDLGDRLAAHLTNRLPRPDEHTSIHWHGIRLPNSEDGVPYLVQPPVKPGESFDYSFVPPDSGTFFFHTHCNTIEQLGRGLVGVLIVDGDTTARYDADEVLLLHDWQLEGDAVAFNPFFTQRGAGRAGTYAPLRSVNGKTDPVIDLPAGGDCRLRVINADPTRIMTIGVDGAEAAVIAIDGIAVSPFALTTWALGPAMRLDLALRAPVSNSEAALYDLSQSERVRLARFQGRGPSVDHGSFAPRPLRAGIIPQPNVRNAERIRFNLTAADNGLAKVAAGPSSLQLGTLCLATNTFWTINGRSWPDRDHAQLPPPLAVLKRGKSYVFEIANRTSFSHPLHFHGHTFTVLSTSKVARPQHHADTILVYPDETVTVAFVADNPGDWMLHCHIIEHQETGMMGYVRVA